MYFVGVDLAWSDRNTTAVAVAAGDGQDASLPHCKSELRSNRDIADFIDQCVGSAPAIVAIDAPLKVPNEMGPRPVDRRITEVFGQFEAGAFPANRSRLGGGVRGESVVQHLLERGFIHNPRLKQYDKRRILFEVYPHTAMVSLFYLDKTLKYKARKGRSYECRYEEYKRYQEYLRGLANSEPKLTPDEESLAKEVSSLRGKGLKSYEDLLDAIFCAYVAYYVWYWGPERYEIFGDEYHGYILVPMTPWMRAQLYSSPQIHLVQE